MTYICDVVRTEINQKLLSHIRLSTVEMNLRLPDYNLYNDYISRVLLKQMMSSYDWRDSYSNNFRLYDTITPMIKRVFNKDED